MISLKDKLEQLLDDKFQEEEFSKLFLVDLKILPGDNIEIFLDSDENVLFQHCARISRYLEEHIEENKWLGEKYKIDVSSSGVGSPLILHRQYVKNIGRNVAVQVDNDHKSIKGVLTEVNDDTIVVSYEEKVKIEGTKKKELITIKKEIPFSNIKKTIVKISF